MSGTVAPAANRPSAGDDRRDTSTTARESSELRLRELVDLYRAADGDTGAASGEVLDEAARRRRLLADWDSQVEQLRQEIAAVNRAMVGTGIRLDLSIGEPGPGVSYLACAEVRIKGISRDLAPSGFAVLTQRSEARMQIRMPGDWRHTSRYVAIDELTPRLWNDWLLDLLEANRARGPQSV